MQFIRQITRHVNYGFIMLLCGFQYALADDVLESKGAQGQSSMITNEKKLDKITTIARTIRTELDELNRNVYSLDKKNIQDKGYQSAEDIFRYTPFIGLANLGLGSSLDLRGQGNMANTSVQVLINGIYSNMLDSSHGVTPLNTLSPASIESIEVLPGGGAVMYGNGTRGGVININTQKRYETHYFNTGLSYSNFLSSSGHNYNVDAKYGTKIRDRLYMSVGAAYIDRGGPRLHDRTNGAQVNTSFFYEINENHSLNFDVDYFYGIIRTTPNNSFMDIANPGKDDRKTPGNGAIHNAQQRFDVSLDYDWKLSTNAKLNLKTFYHLNNIDYLNSVTVLSKFAYNGIMLNNASADQSNSLFHDQKFGFLAKYDLRHKDGRFIAGFESVWNEGKRTMRQFIDWSGQASMGNMQVTGYKHLILIPFRGVKWSNALYAIEKYDFTKNLSLTGGVRYEYAYNDINVNYYNDMTIQMASGGGGGAPGGGSGGARPIKYSKNGSLVEHMNNIALELTPNYRYSETGNIYAKYERGYFSPSPNSMIKRNGSGSKAEYIATNLKKETYDTFEIGIKDYFYDMVMISASAFYTLTSNEFYTQGNPHSINGITYGNYDFTQRAGIELFSEQSFFDDSLVFSESFTYVDARILKNNGSTVTNQYIPYVSNYKATLNASYSFNTKTMHYGIWLQNSFYGAQRDIAQREIKGYILTDLGINVRYKKALTMSMGVRNIFDVFYYSYYNSDASDPIAGYGFLIGGGRNIFAEGRYTF